MSAIFKQILLTVFLGCVSLGQKANAQAMRLELTILDKPFIEVQRHIAFKQNFASKKNCIDYLSQLPNLLYAKGFISSSVDSIKIDSAICHATIFIGEKYVWESLKIEPNNEQYLSFAGIKKQLFLEQPFNPNTVALVQEKLLHYFVNNGYPFAEVKFDSLQINYEKITAKLVINKGLLYQLDSIRQFGNIKLSKDFLYKYLDLAPKTFYNEEKLKNIDKKLAELSFLTQKAPWQLTMLGTGFLVDLFTDVKKNNQVDAIVGFLPNNQQNGGSLLFTADVKLKLQNAFAKGETIAANWQQIQPKSPRINLQFLQPYILKSKFNLDFGFDLFKKDSSFFNIQSTIGLQLTNNKNQKTKVLFQTQQSNLLDVDTATIKITKQLPDIADVVTNSIITEFEWNNTDYSKNPQKGNEFILSLSAGSKKIKKNNTVLQIHDASFNYNNLYNNIQLKTYQLNIKTKMAHYFPLGKYTIIKTGLQAGMLQTPFIYRNEMFQIGGFKTLRGFDEESIYADKYGIATAEYRYLLSANSYFSTFTDIGFTANSLTNINHQYISFGGGLSFETKQGLINISIAAGKRNDLDFNLKQTKIHIGFVSVF